jgi:hypothetical protein
MLNLWRIASCSSAPWLTSEDVGEEDPADVKVRAIDHHDESIYSVAWSPADAWVYCSLSYDGRFVNCLDFISLAHSPFISRILSLSLSPNDIGLW